MAFDKKEKRTARSVLNELVERTNSNTQRLRVLEQRTESSDSRINSIEKDFIELTKNLKAMVKDTESRIAVEDDRVVQIENTVKEIVTHVKRLATSADVRGLQELIDIYNPLKSNFMTRDEVEQLIQEKLTNK